jgi:hypothetical protein
VKAFAFGIDPQRIVSEFSAQHAGQSPVQGIEQVAGFAIRPEQHPTFAPTRHVAQRETHERLGHGQPLDHIADRLLLGPVRAHELQPRGRGVEQIAQLDHRACRQGGGFDRADLSPRHRDLRRIMPACAACDRQSPHRPQGWKRLAAKTETVDVQKVGSVDLGRGMARQGQRQIVRCHAAPVISDTDQGLATIGQRDIDPPRTGIQRVLHQFLDRRGRALHHLARRDPVDRSLIELPDDGAVFAYLGVRMCHAAKPSMARSDSTTIQQRLSADQPPVAALYQATIAARSSASM